MKKACPMTLDKELVDDLDKRRGFIPRSVYVNEILKEHLGYKQEGQWVPEFFRTSEGDIDLNSIKAMQINMLPMTFETVSSTVFLSNDKSIKLHNKSEIEELDRMYTYISQVKKSKK